MVVTQLCAVVTNIVWPIIKPLQSVVATGGVYKGQERSQRKLMTSLRLLGIPR